MRKTRKTGRGATRGNSCCCCSTTSTGTMPEPDSISFFDDSVVFSAREPSNGSERGH